jgi:hypothetical protein
MESRTRLTRNKPSVSHGFWKAHRGYQLPVQRGPLARTARPGPLPSPASALGSGGSTMESNERVTWEDCPNCQRAAAVGWVNGRPVEYDCPRGCCLSVEQVQAFDARHGRRPVDWFTRAW